MRHQFALLALAAIPLSVQADSYTCVSFDYPPLIHKGDSGQPTGFAVDIVTRIFRQMGHTVKMRLFAFNGDFLSLKGFHVGTAHKVNYGPHFEEARPHLTSDARLAHAK